MILTTEQWDAVQAMKAEIKGLAEIQKKEKAILRTPHLNIRVPDGKGGFYHAWYFQWEIHKRAKQITEALIEYNKARGKDFSMYLGKQKAEANG
jgi:hypothetical protein